MHDLENAIVSFHSVLLALVFSLFIEYSNDATMFKLYAFGLLPLKLIVYGCFNYVSSVDPMQSAARTLGVSAFLFLQFLAMAFGNGSGPHRTKYTYGIYDIVFSVVLFVLIKFTP
jgi:hypothetical protein